MSDIADIANDRAEADLAAALKNRPRLATGPSASECEECDAAIPVARQQAVPGVRLCIHCQELLDQSSGFHTGQYR